MDRRRCLSTLHRLCLAGLPLLGGLAQAAPPEMLPPAVMPAPALPKGMPAPATPQSLQISTPVATVLPTEVVETRQIPIGLDTVMRLADEQNAQIGRARAKVDQACSESDLAAKRWFPDVFIGANYYRHEGGIQDQNGDFIRSSTGAILNGLELHSTLDIRDYAYQKVLAERNHWQQRGDLSRLSYETLLDATSTYIDLVAARHAEVVARRLHQDLADLEAKAQKLYEVEKGAEVELVRVRAEMMGREQLIHRLQAQAEAASAKLVYLLGLDPCVELVPVDHALTPINLVDARPEICTLVAQALDQGPGIREMGSMLALIEDSIRRSQGAIRYMPTVEMRVLEGGFGAGPGSEMDWANRMDAIVQVRWNLGALATSRDRQRIAESQRMQAHLAYEDLRGKLTAGVQEAKNSILIGAKEINLASQQVAQANRARQLSRSRLDNNVAGSSYSEVLLSMQAVGLAEVNFISAMRDYDKAQLRLLFLLGGGQPCAMPVQAAPEPEAERIGAPKTSEPEKP